MSNHPIIPSPELVEQWFDKSPLDRELTLATQAAQWGADQELEACCEVLRQHDYASSHLRAARRPKPPSDKELALEALERMQDQYPHLHNKATIRRALERLQQLEEKIND